MLTLKRIKELIPDKTLTDAEAERIRDVLRVFAEIIFEQWQEERQNSSGELKRNE